MSSLLATGFRGASLIAFYDLHTVRRQSYVYLSALSRNGRLSHPISSPSSVLIPLRLQTVYHAVVTVEVISTSTNLSQACCFICSGHVTRPLLRLLDILRVDLMPYDVLLISFKYLRGQRYCSQASSNQLAILAKMQQGTVFSIQPTR